MSGDKEEFAERLLRIQQSRGAGSAGGPPGRDDFPPRVKRKRSGGNGKLILGALLGVVVLVGAASVTASVQGLGIAIGNAVLPEALRQTLPEPSAQAPGFSATTALSKLFGRSDSASPAKSGDPLDYLPEAPNGWIRVTTEDAAGADAMAAIASKWPEQATGTGFLPLKENAGYKQLARFLETYAKPDIEQRSLAKTRTRALYLHPNGEFLTVGLSFLPERVPLGDKAVETSWIDGLAAREEKQLESGEVLERLQLGGLAITSRAKAQGTSLVSRPIGADIYALNGIKIAVPLGHRAVLEVQGLAAPISVEALILSVDRAALMARLP